MKTHQKRLWLVPANPNLTETVRLMRQGYDLDWFHRGLQELAGARQLDMVLIDTQPGLTEETLFALGIADVLTLLLRPEQQDYRGTALVVELARKLDFPRILLIVNEAPGTVDFTLLKRQIAQTYQCDPGAMLPQFEEIMALASTEIFVLRYPHHPLTTHLNRIGDELVKS